MNNKLSLLPSTEHRREIDYILLGAVIGSLFFFILTLVLFRVPEVTLLHIGIIAAIGLYVRKLWTESIPKKYYYYLLALLVVCGSIGFIINKSTPSILLVITGTIGFVILKLIKDLGEGKENIGKGT